MIKKTKKGFTLIELIVVIAVLALLAAVAVPMISSYVDQAKAGEAAANARTIELAMKAYLADNENGASTIDSTAMGKALSAFGLPTKIEGSSADYEVDTDGTVTTSAGDGDIAVKQ